MMQPLAKEDETDAEVTWEDQNNINTFSKIHNKVIDLQDQLSEKNVSLHSFMGEGR
jgi:prefoldin subunit 4